MMASNTGARHRVNPSLVLLIRPRLSMSIMGFTHSLDSAGPELSLCPLISRNRFGRCHVYGSSYSAASRINLSKSPPHSSTARLNLSKGRFKRYRFCIPCPLNVTSCTILAVSRRGSTSRKNSDACAPSRWRNVFSFTPVDRMTARSNRPTITIFSSAGAAAGWTGAGAEGKVKPALC